MDLTTTGTPMWGQPPIAPSSATSVRLGSGTSLSGDSPLPLVGPITIDLWVDLDLEGMPT